MSSVLILRLAQWSPVTERTPTGLRSQLDSRDEMTAYTAVKRSEHVFESGRIQRVATHLTFFKFFQFCGLPPFQLRSGEVPEFFVFSSVQHQESYMHCP